MTPPPRYTSCIHSNIITYVNYTVNVSAVNERGGDLGVRLNSIILIFYLWMGEKIYGQIFNEWFTILAEFFDNGLSRRREDVRGIMTAKRAPLYVHTGAVIKRERALNEGADFRRAEHARSKRGNYDNNLITIICAASCGTRRLAKVPTKITIVSHEHNNTSTRKNLRIRVLRKITYNPITQRPNSWVYTGDGRHPSIEFAVGATI